jgi:hypothetical protein
MIINGDHSIVPPADRRASVPEPQGRRGSRRPRPEDVVEISDAARGMSAAQAEKPAPLASGENMRLTLYQVRGQLQERIRGGFYDSEGVLSDIASRILDVFGL